MSEPGTQADTLPDITPPASTARSNLSSSSKPGQLILDSINDHVAMLDENGVIRAVNEPWRRFAQENGDSDSLIQNVGVSYLRTCRSAMEKGLPEALLVHEGVTAVLAGKRDSFELEYACGSSDGLRWFSLKVVPLPSPRVGAVLIHSEITSLKQARAAVQQSQEKLRLITEAVPALLFRLNPAGLCDYANAQFYQNTGMPEGSALGLGWVQAMRMEDRGAFW